MTVIFPYFLSFFAIFCHFLPSGRKWQKFPKIQNAPSLSASDLLYGGSLHLLGEFFLIKSKYSYSLRLSEHPQRVNGIPSSSTSTIALLITLLCAQIFKTIQIRVCSAGTYEGIPSASIFSTVQGDGLSFCSLSLRYDNHYDNHEVLCTGYKPHHFESFAVNTVVHATPVRQKVPDICHVNNI